MALFRVGSSRPPSEVAAEMAPVAAVGIVLAGLYFAGSALFGRSPQNETGVDPAHAAIVQSDAVENFADYQRLPKEGFVSEVRALSGMYDALKNSEKGEQHLGYSMEQMNSVIAKLIVEGRSKSTTYDAGLHLANAWHPVERALRHGEPVDPVFLSGLRQEIKLTLFELTEPTSK